MINVGETPARRRDAGEIAISTRKKSTPRSAGWTLMEPVMIAFLGVVVGGIVIAMYMRSSKDLEAERGDRGGRDDGRRSDAKLVGITAGARRDHPVLGSAV